MNKGKTIAVILSGGTGTRLGTEIPKQYLTVKGKTIFEYTLEAISRNSNIDLVWVVCSFAYKDIIEAADRKNVIKGFSQPGDTRQLSIMNALKDIDATLETDDETIVLIADAARPLTTEELLNRIFDEMPGHDGVIPTIPMKDTLYISGDGKKITSLIDRKTVMAGQSPEAFLLKKYLKACLDLPMEKLLTINGSTEPAVMAGMDIKVVEGDENNFKITTQNDLEKFEEIIR